MGTRTRLDICTADDENGEEYNRDDDATGEKALEWFVNIKAAINRLLADNKSRAMEKRVISDIKI